MNAISVCRRLDFAQVDLRLQKHDFIVERGLADIGVPGPGPTVTAVAPAVAALLQGILEFERRLLGPHAYRRLAGSLQQKGERRGARTRRGREAEACRRPIEDRLWQRHGMIRYAQGTRGSAATLDGSPSPIQPSAELPQISEAAFFANGKSNASATAARAHSGDAAGSQ